MSTPISLRELLDNPLDGFLDSILPRTQDRTDAIHRRFGSFPPEPYLSEIETALETHIYRRLGHISIELGEDSSSNHTIRDAYQFADSVPDDRRVANRNEQSEHDLVLQLIDEARRQQAATATTSSAARELGRIENLFILHGDKGIGKTFLLNHMLAACGHLLNEHKVIWVRLDLSRHYPTVKEFPIQDRIKAKLAKLLLRYHDVRSSQRTSIASNVKRFGVYQLTKDRLQEPGLFLNANATLALQKLDALSELWTFSLRNESILPDSVPEILGNTLFNIALSQGYSILAVLDGLDCFDTTDRSREAFEELLGQLSELLVSSRLAIAFLVVCRTESRERILVLNELPANHARRRDFLVAPVPLEAILERRKNAILAELPRIAAKIPRVQERIGSETGLREFTVNLNAFFGNIPLPELERLLPDRNRRAQMQCIQLLYHHSLDEFGGKRYKLTEMIALGGREYPPQFFWFRRRGAALRREATGTVSADARLFPNIFLAPPIDEDGDRFDTGFLLGIRVLQILESHRALKVKKGEELGSVRMDAGELLELVGLFNYSDEAALTFLEELKDFDCVELSGGYMEMPSDRLRYMIRLLPRGVVVLHELISEVAYLNVVAMRIPLSHRSFENDELFIRAESANPRKQEIAGRFAVRWSIAKVINALSLVRLCRAINKVQQGKLWEGRVTRLTHEASGVLKQMIDTECFSFDERMAKAVVGQCEAIFRALPPSGRKEVSRAIERYAARWAVPSESETS